VRWKYSSLKTAARFAPRRGLYRGWNVKHFHEHLKRDHHFRWGYTSLRSGRFAPGRHQARSYSLCVDRVSARCQSLRILEFVCSFEQTSGRTYSQHNTDNSAEHEIERARIKHNLKGITHIKSPLLGERGPGVERPLAPPSWGLPVRAQQVDWPFGAELGRFTAGRARSGLSPTAAHARAIHHDIPANDTGGHDRAAHGCRAADRTMHDSRPVGSRATRASDGAGISLTGDPPCQHGKNVPHNSVTTPTQAILPFGAM
jgi:hypothetical protein